jgi:hypothetical protein
MTEPAPNPSPKPEDNSPVAHSTLVASQTVPIGTALIDEKSIKDLGQLAEELLKDPVKVQLLSDRVFQLLKQDMIYQLERDRGYGRRF